ncbi:MAG: ribonuclease / adenosylcobalamin/alpha-ribazole phosphatase [Chloroflexota bacterium]|nr:ribonuclease / adenosylcobalamin/alpha-ribazole phosphatase [Chloroflexota bacterium]
MSNLVIHTDGGARGNPGPAAIGVVLEVERDGARETIGEVAETIGVASNNVAEYRAIIRALEAAERLGASSVTCLLDSLLVVEQLNGRYRVKSEDMKPLHARVRELAGHFALVTFQHVRREQNQEADRLVNLALDGRAAEVEFPLPPA